MLKLQNITKTYPKKPLFENLNLTIERGKIIGLIGENGAGKSSLLAILASLTKPDAGTVFWDDISFKKRKEYRTHIGYVPQQLAIWEHLSVEDNMKFFAALSHVKVSLDECRKLCEQMQLFEWKEKVSRLSGGTKRKLNIAISLIHQPNLILLDEPTVGIDMKSKEEIGRYLKKLADENKTIIYTSHDMNEIESYCDYVYMIGQDAFYYDFLSSKGVPITRL